MKPFAPQVRVTTVELTGDLRAEAARKRLHECKTREQACEVIREIVSNLLGCEEMALFEVDAREKRLTLMWSFGIEPAKRHLRTLSDEASSDVLTGKVWVAPACGYVGTALDEHQASAFVPIKFGGKTTAVLAMLRLLPQKAKIEEFDRTLLAVISSEAGEPLFTGHGSGKSERKP
jgi:chemotaxis protein CheD